MRLRAALGLKDGALSVLHLELVQDLLRVGEDVVGVSVAVHVIQPVVLT